MKNLHVLPTDKPSRLFFNKIDNNFTLDYDFENTIKENWFQDYHIYITNSEEIKEGDWFMSDFNSFPIHNIKELSEREGTLGWEQKDLKNNLKIILTTDPDLIRDGVQAINDEFLEWFVKNPSCEYVKINHFGTCCGNQFITQCINCKKYNPVYKIIIPKEEPKQETFEEAIKQELENHFFSNISEIKQAEYFINFGAKWQQEQDKKMYSEEDMIEFSKWRIIYEDENPNNVKHSKKLLQIWLEQFKKK